MTSTEDIEAIARGAAVGPLDAQVQLESDDNGQWWRISLTGRRQSLEVKPSDLFDEANRTASFLIKARLYVVLLVARVKHKKAKLLHQSIVTKHLDER